MFRQLMIVFALAAFLLAAPVVVADEPMGPREVVTDWVGQWLAWIGLDFGPAPKPPISVEKSSDGGPPPSPPEGSDPQDPDGEIGMHIDPNG